MVIRVALVVLAAFSAHGFPAQQAAPQQAKPAEPKQQQVLLLPERQQQFNPPQIQYDLALLEPQFQIPPYNFIGDKQHFPRVQPQIVLYHGGANPGQPFLLQPGSPPGNFLVPQPGPGPNVILRDAPARPPVFVAGYPKPAHIPPIEKDAEEIPTNPSKIPPLGSPKAAGKPEKVETFNEPDPSKKQATEAEVLAAADRNPAFNTRTNGLRPGQRFFILNGQPLFSYENQLYPGVGLKYSSQPTPSFDLAPKNVSPYQNLLLRNAQFEELTPSHRLGDATLNPYPENLVLLNQPFQNDLLFKTGIPTGPVQTKDAKPETRGQFKFNSGSPFGLFQLQDDQVNDAIIIDAREQDQAANVESDSEVVSAPQKTGEPTIAQAQPGAIALAGPGGVAAAAPRGNSFVGKDGVAVASPQATAIAGPTRDEIQQKNKKQEGNIKRKP